MQRSIDNPQHMLPEKVFGCVVCDRAHGDDDDTVRYCYGLLFSQPNFETFLKYKIES